MGFSAVAASEKANCTATTIPSSPAAQAANRQNGHSLSAAVASGSARPARKNSTLETIRFACSQKAVALTRVSEDEIGAPVSRSMRMAETTRAAAVIAATTETSRACAPSAAA